MELLSHQHGLSSALGQLPTSYLTTPEGSKYHNSTYIDPKVGILEPLEDPGTYHIVTWTFWEHKRLGEVKNRGGANAEVVPLAAFPAGAAGPQPQRAHVGIWSMLGPLAGGHIMTLPYHDFGAYVSTILALRVDRQHKDARVRNPRHGIEGSESESASCTSLYEKFWHLPSEGVP